MTDISGSDSPRKIFDVLIVGAGPVGLATAIGLRKRGIKNILVIEQAREFRKVGQGLDLLPNGLRALKYIDLKAYEKITENALSDSFSAKDEQAPQKKRIWSQRNTQGEITRSFPTDFQSWFDRYGEGRVNVSWFNLQSKLKSLLPIEAVQANHRCIHVEEEVGCIRIDTISNSSTSKNPFAHWEMMQKKVDASVSNQENQNPELTSFRAKVVVAADGINSKIRQVIYDTQELRKWSQPKYSGFAAISSRIDNVPSEVFKELDARYIKGDRIITVHNNSGKYDVPELKLLRLMLICLPNNSIAFLLYSLFSEDSWKNKSLTEVRDLGIQALKKAEFPSIFIEFIGLTNPEKLSFRPLYMHPVSNQDKYQPSWSKGRVVLVGDAAHAMPPFMAQGANQGFEDAAVIVTLIAELFKENGLDEDNRIATIFQRYEQIRRAFSGKVQAATMISHQWTQEEWDDFNEMLHRREYPSAITLGE